MTPRLSAVKISEKTLARLAKRNNFVLTKEERRVFCSTIRGLLSSYDRLDALSGSTQKQLKINGYLPSRAENPYNAWAWKCSIRFGNRRLKNKKLIGKKIAIKDNILVANLPLRNGSQMFEGYVPSINATIVSRILQSGGEVAGKSTCENLCTSGGSHTSYPRPVNNPHDPDYMAGGSSSGSAALLASREVDMAIGGDQAGSIRIPSSWCGVYGLKPTLGLVPFTGVLGMESVLDYVGPMANNVEDLALLLEVIAGRDEQDPRQLNAPDNVPRYSEMLRCDRRKKLRIALIREGFGWEKISEQVVDKKVRDAAFSFQDMGEKVNEVSIPIHRDAIHVWSALCTEGIWSNVVRPHGLEHHWCGVYDVNLIENWSRALKSKGNKLAETAKMIGILGDYIADRFEGKQYALAHNLRNKIIQSYDNVLNDYDLLVMPTTPQRAQLLKGRRNLEWSIKASMNNLQNTCAFDVSGHPALSVPCGFVDGLPVGMMLIGRYYDETTILRAALTFERKES